MVTQILLSDANFNQASRHQLSWANETNKAKSSAQPETKGSGMALRIEDYAMIGDCETAALVGRDGSIDWLCWPRFDSAACFAALLGDEGNGRGLISPQGAMRRVTRRYRPDTLILETEFETADGVVALVDFMPLRGASSHV